MIKTFIERPNDEISFLLFLHVPSEVERDLRLSIEEIDQVLSTQTQKLKKIIEELNLDSFDKQKFIDHLVIRFGKSIDELEDEIQVKLTDIDRFKAIDAEGLLYPNFLTEIQRISTIKEHENRKVTKQEIFQFLTRQSKAVINKWTLMTKSRRTLLKTLRSDFLLEMNPNSLSRCFIFKGFEVEEIDKIANLINIYVEKYLRKQSHKPATFLFDIDKEKFTSLILKLHDQGIEVNDGIVGGVWRDNRFYKNHICERRGRSILHHNFQIRAQTLLQENFIIREDFFNQTKNFGHIETEINYSIDTIMINKFEEVEYLFNFRGDI